MSEELTDKQRRVLELIYAHFDEKLDWPERRVLQRQLARQYVHDLEVEDVAHELKPRYIHLDEAVGGKVWLTLRGLKAIYRSTELSDLVCFVRFGVERNRELTEDPPQITATEFVARCGVDNKRIRKFDLLLKGELSIAWVSASSNDGAPSAWRLNDNIWKYHSVFDIDSYLNVRDQGLAQLRDDPVPPVSLLAIEGEPPAAEQLGAVAALSIAPEQLFEVLEDLREQRDKAEDLRNSLAEGALDVWERRTLDLIARALGSDHYDYKSFEHAAEGSYMPATPTATFAQKERIRIANLQRRLGPHLPPLEDAIEEAGKKLAKMAGNAVPAAPVAGAGALPTIDFAFVKDARLRSLAERDYKELRVATYYRNVKSKAVLAGSVVEAVVLDLILAKGVPFEELKGLTAHGLYERAKKEQLLAGRQSSAADASRDTRNFVHPAVEFREGALTPEQSDLSLSLMFAILAELGVTS